MNTLENHIHIGSTLTDKLLPEVELNGLEELKIFEGYHVRIIEESKPDKYYFVRGVEINPSNREMFAVLYSETKEMDQVRLLLEPEMHTLKIYSVRELELEGKSFYP